MPHSIDSLVAAARASLNENNSAAGSQQPRVRTALEIVGQYALYEDHSPHKRAEGKSIEALAAGINKVLRQAKGITWPELYAASDAGLHRRYCSPSQLNTYIRARKDDMLHKFDCTGMSDDDIDLCARHYVVWKEWRNTARLPGDAMRAAARKFSYLFESNASIAEDSEQREEAHLCYTGLHNYTAVQAFDFMHGLGRHSIRKLRSKHLLYVLPADPSQAFGIPDARALKNLAVVHGRLGRLLARCAPNCSPAEIQHLVNMERPGELVFLTSEEDVMKAYCSPQISSCMDRQLSCNQIHPALVYAECPNMAIAAISVEGMILARAVVNTYDCTFTTVYGDYAIKALLEEEGYTDDDYMDYEIRNLVDSYGRQVMPYIDGDNQYWDGTTNSDGTLITLSDHGDVQCQQTDGYAGHVFYCEYCEEGCADELVSVIHQGNWIEVCDSCRDRRFTYVERHHEYYHDDEVTHCATTDRNELLTDLIYNDETSEYELV